MICKLTKVGKLRLTILPRLNMPKMIRIEKTTIDKIAILSNDLPQKEPSDYPLRESIELLLPQIENLQKKGYSIEEISKIYTQNGLAISATTLRQYLNDLSKKPKVERAKKSKSKSSISVGEEQKPTAPSADSSERAETQASPEVSVEIPPTQADTQTLTTNPRSSVKPGFNLVDTSNL